MIRGQYAVDYPAGFIKPELVNAERIADDVDFGGEGSAGTESKAGAGFGGRASGCTEVINPHGESKVECAADIGADGQTQTMIQTSIGVRVAAWGRQSWHSQFNIG